MTAVDMPKIDVALVCDDIRREITGKDIVIGIYGAEILVASFPAGLILSLYLRLKFSKPNTDYPIELRGMGPSGQQLVPTFRSVINSQNPEYPTTVALSGIPLQVQSPGPIQFQWKLEGADWETIAQVKVKQGSAAPVASNTSTSMPSG